MPSALGRNGSTRKWREIRERTLRRDRHICHYCGGYADTVDHVMPRWLGGSDHPTNLVACCTRCQKPDRRPMPDFKVGTNGHAGGVPSLHTPENLLPVLRGTMTRSRAKS